MTRRTRRPLRSDLSIHEKTKDERELLENCDSTTKGWCKVFNENSLVPNLKHSVFRFDKMLFGNMNMAAGEGYKIRPENVGKDEKFIGTRQMKSNDKIRARRDMEDLEAKRKDFIQNSLTCDGDNAAWKDELFSNDCFTKESSSNSFKVTLSGSPNKGCESRKPGNLSPVENLYMKLQNGESSGERFVNPGVTPENGRLANQLFDNSRTVQAFCEAMSGSDRPCSCEVCHDLESTLFHNEHDFTPRNTSRTPLIKSYPRRNGICYRSRIKDEDRDLDDVHEPLNSLAVVCFVDEKNITQNNVEEEKIDNSGVEDEPCSLNCVKEKEPDDSEDSSVSSLPRKRQRRPPQSYSPSNSHGSYRLARKYTVNPLRKRTPLARQLIYKEEKIEPEKGNTSEVLDTVATKKRRRKRREKVIKEDEQTATEESTNIDSVSYVLGVRRLYKGNGLTASQALVQFKDGTSNWISADNLNSLQGPIVDYFTDTNQKIHIVNRLPYNMYCRTLLPPPNISNCIDISSNVSTDLKNKDKRRLEKDVEVTTPTDTSNHKLSSESPSRSTSPPETKEFNSTTEQISSTEETTQPFAQVEHQESIGYTSQSSVHQNDRLACDPIRTGMLSNILDSPSVSPSRTHIKDVEVIQHDAFVHIVVRGKHASPKFKKINPEICEKLVEHLEEYSVDDSVRLVVISGLEDHFSTKMDLMDVARLPAWMEGHECKQSVLKLRYLVQTVRHYCKPLIAVISHPSRGLSASLLSLFDMVFDKEKGVELFGSSSQNVRELSVLFPRLMGLAAKGEQLLMGEKVEDTLEERISQTELAFRGTKYSYNLTESLKDVKGNLRKRHFSTKTCTQGSKVLGNVTGGSASLLHSPSEKRALRGTEFIKRQIEREKELAKSCLRDISLFWNELRNKDVEEVVS